MDNDDDVEVIVANHIYDHNGVHQLTTAQPPGSFGATSAADLDGDGDLELILGHAAYHHDNSEYYVNTQISTGYPQVANLDDDPMPEVLLTNPEGITVLEHDGAIKYQDLRPTGEQAGLFSRAATIHDFDGDDEPEYALFAETWYTLYERDALVIWSAEVAVWLSGYAPGTAFDFLGDGSAEAMYGDDERLSIFDENGAPVLQVPRVSVTVSDYPIVADVDNDASAEIVVVSNTTGTASTPTVQVIGDIDDRWIQARRIWNQHTYHVTNVREDGTIPQFEPPSWESFNTFRTNAQIEGGRVCNPEG